MRIYKCLIDGSIESYGRAGIVIDQIYSIGECSVISLIHGRIYNFRHNWAYIQSLERVVIRGKIPLRSLVDLSRCCYIPIIQLGTKYGKISYNIISLSINTYIRHRVIKKHRIDDDNI